MLGTKRGSLRRKVMLFSATLATTGMLAACGSDSSNASTGDIPDPAEAIQGVDLHTREDVIRAVSSVWAAVSEYNVARAPTRPLPATEAAEGTVTEDCADGGNVTFNEDEKITSYDGCTAILEETNETTGETRTDTLTISGSIDESCQLADGEVETTDHRCLGFVALDAVQSTSIVTPPADAESESTSTESATRTQEDALLKVFAESDSGFTLRVDQSARRDQSTEDADGMTSDAFLSWETAGLDLSMTNTGDAEAASFVMAFDGELAFSTNADDNCSAGTVRIGTTEDLTVEPDTNLGPTGGQLVLSTADVGALAVRFNTDSGITFTLGGETMTVTGEEMNGGCLGSFAELPGDGQTEESPAEDICLVEPLCFPTGGF